jgi:branched-chain amino acid aminotransferase
MNPAPSSPSQPATSVNTEYAEYVFFENQFVPFSQAKISIRNPSFLYGTSLFEGIRGYWLPESQQISVFRMQAHYERLLLNSRLLHMTPEYTLDDLCNITIELIQRNKPQQDIYIRPTLYKSGEAITPSLDQTPTDFCLWTKPLGDYLDLTKGLSVCVSSWQRVSDNAIPARIKAGGAYINTALAVTDARKMGFDDAIFLTQQGTVSEGSAMNLFLVKNNTLITPSKTEDILEGITRDSLIILAKNGLNLDTVERPVDRSELYGADEAFFCGTGAQVAPITAIDNRLVGGSQSIGPITRQLQQLYFETVKNVHAQYQPWCTLVSCQV